MRCSVLCFLLKQGAAGLSLTLRPTKFVIDRCVNVPARDAPGRNGRSWGSHMNPPLNSCVNVSLSGRWAHDANVWFFKFFRTCRVRLDDAVGYLLTSGDGYMFLFVVSCPAAHSASIMSGFLLCCSCPAACFASIMSSVLLCFSCPVARFASIMLRFRASFVVQSSTGRYFLQAL